jgi:hypothetical protein
MAPPSAVPSAGDQVGYRKREPYRLLQVEDRAVHGVQPVVRRRGVEVKLPDLPDVVLVVQDDDQVEGIPAAAYWAFLSSRSSLTLPSAA